MRLSFIILACFISQACQEEINTRSAVRHSADGSCGNKDNSGLSVVNGQATGQHKSVALLIREAVTSGKREVAICTGTFIGDNVLITAGHCVDDSVNGGIIALQVDSYDTAVIDTVHGFAQARSRGVEAVQVFHQGYTENDLIGANGEAINLDKTYLDMAVVLFPDGTSSAASAIQTDSPHAGSEGIIVGFGQTTFEGKHRRTDAVKREGKVVIAGPQTGKGLISLYSKGANGNRDQTYASSASGDSGGPLFIDGKLTGISSSGGDYGGDYGRVSIYVDLNSAESQALLKRAKAAGANLHNGLSGSLKPNSQTSPGC